MVMDETLPDGLHLDEGLAIAERMIDVAGLDDRRGRALGVAEPAPAPPELDYEMWLGPAPLTPFTADRCRPRSWPPWCRD